MNKISFQNKFIIDIDYIFRNTNENFTSLLENMGINTNFDFSKRNNKKLYTHEFIKTFTEFLKINSKEHFIFFSNTLTKDTFRNQLLKKIKKIFNIKILERNYDLDHLSFKISSRDAALISEIEMMFLVDNPPSFKKISKYLEKEGLTFLNETYFQNVVNKMIIFTY